MGSIISLLSSIVKKKFRNKFLFDIVAMKFEIIKILKAFITL